MRVDMLRRGAVVLAAISVAVGCTGAERRETDATRSRPVAPASPVTAAGSVDSEIVGQPTAPTLAEGAVSFDGGPLPFDVDLVMSGEPHVGGVITGTAVITIPSDSPILAHLSGPTYAIEARTEMLPLVTVDRVDPACDVCGTEVRDNVKLYSWTTSMTVGVPITITVAGTVNAAGSYSHVIRARPVEGELRYSGQSAWDVTLGATAGTGSLAKLN